MLLIILVTNYLVLLHVSSTIPCARSRTHILHSVDPVALLWLLSRDGDTSWIKLLLLDFTDLHTVLYKRSSLLIIYLATSDSIPPLSHQFLPMRRQSFLVPFSPKSHGDVVIKSKNIVFVTGWGLLRFTLFLRHTSPSPSLA